MSRKGGYLIIDLKNNDLMDSPTIEGIYDLIEGNYGKSILLSGIMISNVEKADVFTKPDVSSSTFVFKNVYGYDISVNDEDEVTIASTEVATRAYVDNKIETLVEGGTLDNAKPIYCHPLDIILGSNGRIGCLIFNNSSTPFTKNTFVGFIEDLFASVGDNCRIISTGVFYTDSGAYPAVGILRRNAATNQYALYSQKLDGTAITVDFNDAETFISEITYINDGVNKIN